jgi:mannose-6-phosphate isomerase-like protein (cupin superfamily)
VEHEHKKLKTITTTIKDFLATPKEFLSKLLEENLGRLTVKLQSQELYIMTKEMYELFVRLEVRKERVVFEEKYRALKERFTKVKEDVDVSRLTKAQQTLVQLENKFELFDNMTNGELLAVVENIQLLRMERGERVFTVNNTTKEMFFILGGAVAIVINDVEVAILKRNSFFGEMAYIANQPRSATVKVKTEQAILLSFIVKEEVDPTQSEAFMKLFGNINGMLVRKIEDMNKKFAK